MDQSTKGKVRMELEMWRGKPGEPIKKSRVINCKDMDKNMAGLEQGGE